MSSVTAQDLLAWLDASGYYVDWIPSEWRNTVFYAALNPFAQNSVTKEGLEDLAQRARDGLNGADVTAHVRDTHAYMFFRGKRNLELVNGRDQIRACEYGGLCEERHQSFSLEEINSLILWDQGSKLCEIMILPNQ